MYRLVDVALKTLGTDANYASNAKGAIALLKSWPNVMGPEHPLERELEGNSLAWFVYAYTVVKYAVDHFPNPTARASVQQSRQDLLHWGSAPVSGVQPFMALVNAAPRISRLLGPSTASPASARKGRKRAPTRSSKPASTRKRSGGARRTKRNAAKTSGKMR